MVREVSPRVHCARAARRHKEKEADPTSTTDKDDKSCEKSFGDGFACDKFLDEMNCGRARLHSHPQA